MGYEHFGMLGGKSPEEQEDDSRSSTRRKAVQDPMWAAQRIIILEASVRLLEERIRDLEDEYVYHRPKPRGL